MRILLVYPRYPDTFWSFRDALKFVRKKASFPPLGLLTIASMLPPDWEARLIDMNVRRLKDRDIQWADQVWISAMEIQKESVKEIVAKAREHGKRIVAGGPMFTTSHGSYEGIDHLVLDEGEVTLPLFLADLEKGDPKAVYRSDLRKPLDVVPKPRWDLIRFKDYDSMLVQYSRGCPFNCDFCNISVLNGRIPRTKSVTVMIDELESLYDMGYRGQVFFVDDNFIGNKSSVKSMLRELISWQKARGSPFSFITEASVNLSEDSELIQLLIDARFLKVFLGIETPNKESLNECGKVQNARCDLESCIDKLHTNGLQVMGGFIVGFDNDDDTIFDRQIDFIQRTGITTAMVGLLNAPPGTRLWDRLEKEGRLKGEATGSNTDGTLNFIPKMDQEQLIEGYRRIVRTIYSYENYYRRIDVFLNHYKPTINRHIMPRDIYAFVRSVVLIGFLSGASYHYWKLIIKTLTFRRSAFPVAIEMAIYGTNFNKASKKLLKTLG